MSRSRFAPSSRAIGFATALMLALAACGSKASSGPAWPSRQDPEKDGGESLEPRTGESLASLEDDDDETADDKPAEAAKSDTKVETPEAPTPTVTPPVTPSPIDEPVFTEEIIIEIED